MKNQIPGRHLRITKALLVTVLASAYMLVRAAEAPPKPLFADAAPVCPCESLAEWFQFFLLQNPKWDWTTLTPAGFEQLWRQSVEQYGAVIGTDDPDLTRFRDRGGRIIIYHGLADQLIPAAGTIDYYKRVQQHMGGAEKVSQFARLFLAPGVDHAFRGAGATPIGQMEAIVHWVEEGQAPDKLMAERRDSSGKVIQTRPLFPFPQVAKYKGSGSTDEAENFAPARPQGVR